MHGKREDLRVEVLVEGTTVKAGRIHAKLSRAWSTRLGYSMEHHVVYAPSRKTNDPARPDSARLGLALPVIERAAVGPKHANAAEADRACRIGPNDPAPD